MASVPFIQNAKVCGITRVEDAARCAALGFGAIGFVFHPASPRNISPQAARGIVQTLPPTLAAVGVFVDEPVETMLAIADAAGLATLQLHGRETPETVARLQAHGFSVVKVARSANEARALIAALPPTTSILLECGRGPLPGGNGIAWNWAEARLSERRVGIAGGLSPENLHDAIQQSSAIACDLSSGVETTPGIKDPAALERLAAATTPLPPAPAPFWKLDA
jgi:phosphoribosylanthranilate isomerase